MKALIISDIHGNLNALKAVFNDAQGDYEEVWCLGDIVGYGPSPNQCIEYLQTENHTHCILGNHDAAAASLVDTNAFNHDARRSMNWTKTTLLSEYTEFLASLPETVVVEQPKASFTLVHGSPRAPIYEYILDSYIASINFKEFETDYCFIGHSHVPSMFILDPETNKTTFEIPRPGQYPLTPRMIINPGSVGQPRDQNPLASYLILDTEELKIDYRRVSYNIQSTQEKMIAFNLPDKHISRLKLGI